MRAWLTVDGQLYHVEFDHPWDRVPVVGEDLLFSDRSRAPSLSPLVLSVAAVTWTRGRASLSLEVNPDSPTGVTDLDVLRWAGLHRFGENPDCATCRAHDEGRIEGDDWMRMR